MPTWLIQAMMSLRGLSSRGVGIVQRTGVFTRAAGGGAAGLALADPAGGLLPGLGGGGDDGRPHRHRRKRLLTAQMKSDISYIAAVMGAPAAKAAMLIAVSK